MKMAISIPDELFFEAEKYAKSCGVSRSRLYATAVAQFLEQHLAKRITKQLNEVYSSKPEKLDKTLSAMQFLSLEKEKW